MSCYNTAMKDDPHNKGARMPEKFYTAEDLADYLKVSPQTVRAWIRDGKLHAVKFGRSWRIAEEEVRRIAAQGVEED